MPRTKPPEAVRSILYIHRRLRYYPGNNPTYFLATSVTKMLDHNMKGGIAVQASFFLCTMDFFERQC